MSQTPSLLRRNQGEGLHLGRLFEGELLCGHVVHLEAHHEDRALSLVSGHVRVVGEGVQVLTAPATIALKAGRAYDVHALVDSLLERPMRRRVEALQAAMREMPQAELETLHHFADGMYARVLPRPAGTLIVGKVHKREHFYIVAKGRVRVTTDEGVRDVCAGSVVVSRPGTKRAVYALEDSVCLTVHRTDRTDLDEIEAELVEPDPTALLGADNKPKELP